jgi:TonB family protein
MALRALLFSSDGSATSSLCEILTDLSIEAEICTEVLVATERLTRENYDALVVDWDQEPEAILLLKAVREKKAGQALNLALVKEDKQVGHALQQGANSVIKKPIDHRQAADTLSTARDLILSRRAEQKYKEARIAATNAEAAAEFADYRDDTPAQKTGFLQQTAPRSAFEAATQTGEPEPADSQPSGWQAARGPEELRADREQVHEVRVPEKKRWDENKAAPKVEEPVLEKPVATDSTPNDSNGVFSSLPEESEPEGEARPKPHSQRLGFVLVACLLIAGVLYVWAPGDSYGGRLSSIWHLLPLNNKTKPTATASAPPAPSASVTPPQAASKTDDPPPDSAPLATTDVDPSKIQIIETKPVPKTGAQLPPSDTPPPGSDQAQAQAQSQSNGIASTSSVGTDPTGSLAAPQAPRTETDPPSATSAKPAIVSIAQQRPSVPLPTGAAPPSTVEGRGGVVIPDSLKNAPSPAPGSNLEPTAIPEEVSRGLLIHDVEAVYPDAALSQHLEGAVILQVWVAKDGSVQDVKLMKGYIQLGRAAVDAVRQWRFKPYTPDGKPINFQTSITVSFKSPNG